MRVIPNKSRSGSRDVPSPRSRAAFHATRIAGAFGFFPISSYSILSFFGVTENCRICPDATTHTLSYALLSRMAVHGFHASSSRVCHALQTHSFLPHHEDQIRSHVANVRNKPPSWLHLGSRNNTHSQPFSGDLQPNIRFRWLLIRQQFPHDRQHRSKFRVNITLYCVVSRPI